MTNTFSISEIVGTFGADGTEVQVCAGADADYDAAAQKVSVALSAFVRRVGVSNDGEHVPPPWLPPAQRVAEHLPRTEATAFARDVFGAWVKKVRAAIPSELARTAKEKPPEP